MATVVDELITRYTLDPRSYVSGSKAVQNATRQTATHMGQAQNRLGSFASSMRRAGSSIAGGFKSLGISGKGLASAFSAVQAVVGNVISFVQRLATVSVGAAAGLAAIAYAATTQYAAFETIRLTFAGLADSMEKADQMMRAIKGYSLKSVFDEEPLARAALQLAQIRLEAGEYLPIIEAIAIRSGEITPDKLLEVVSILRRLRGGQIADALGPEGLGRFGIGREELIAFGAMVDGSGEFKMNVEQALNVVKAIANSPESKRIKEMLEGSPQTRISNALGALQAAFREFGAAASQFVIPALESIASVAQFLAESGWLKQLSSGFAELFGEDDGKRGFIKFLFTVVSAFEVIGSYLGNIVRNAVQAFEVISAVNLKVLQGLTLPLRAMLWALDKVRGTNLVGELDKMLSGISKFGLLGGLAANLYGFEELGDAIRNGADAKMASFDAWQKSKSKKEAAGGNAFPNIVSGTSSENPVQQALNDIARSTGDTASNTKQQLDMQRYVLGGGDLGRLGVTPLEMSRGEVKVKVDSGAATLDDWVSALINKAVRELRRQGKL